MRRAVDGRTFWRHVVLLVAVSLVAASFGFSRSRETPQDRVADTPTTSATSSTTSSAAPSEKPAPTGTTALAAWAALPVKGRAPSTGYEREHFGTAWADADRNGCDTRNDILSRDLVQKSFKPATRNCVVLSGMLPDKYSGRDIVFERGPGSMDVQIDHVVALQNAWVTGAFTWEVRKRLAFANDPLNLFAVSGLLNAQKGSGDAATWLPPNKAFRCEYVARQVAVKAKYELWVTPAEHEAMHRILSRCPKEPLPSSAAPTIAPIRPAATTTSTSVPSGVVSTPPAPAVGTDPDLGSCAAAGAAGYGPYYEGTDPEYDYYHDADQDGVVCER